MWFKRVLPRRLGTCIRSTALPLRCHFYFAYLSNFWLILAFMTLNVFFFLLKPYSGIYKNEVFVFEIFFLLIFSYRHPHRLRWEFGLVRNWFVRDVCIWFVFMGLLGSVLDLLCQLESDARFHIKDKYFPHITASFCLDGIFTIKAIEGRAISAGHSAILMRFLNCKMLTTYERSHKIIIKMNL